MKILVTGAAGFIGFHLSRSLLSEGHTLIGLDSLNNYYDPQLKCNRLKVLGITDINDDGPSLSRHSMIFYKTDITQRERLQQIFSQHRPDIVIHLAAQAGVRHSLYQPQSFIDSNIQGTFNVLETIREFPVQHFLYASSSSVYGSHNDIPFHESANTDQPISLYGATKKATEMMVHAYARLYDIPSTGLRFFTVYGPWGRPDMAYYKFADLIRRDQQIDIYNHGRMERDFTYVDDICSGIISLMHYAPPADIGHRILNIGRSHPVNLLLFVELLEKHLQKKATRNFLPLQPGEIPSTWADVTALHELTGYAPQTDLEEGIRNFAQWYMEYHDQPTVNVSV